MQILNIIFANEINQDKLNELSKRQIDLVNFYYDKGYHFEMMNGIISGCYEKICDLYSDQLMHDYQILYGEFSHKIETYLLRYGFLVSAMTIDNQDLVDNCLKGITKKSGDEIVKVHNQLIRLMDYVGVEDNQVDVLFKQFDDARNHVLSLKSG